MKTPTTEKHRERKKNRLRRPLPSTYIYYYEHPELINGVRRVDTPGASCRVVCTRLLIVSMDVFVEIRWDGKRNCNFLFGYSFYGTNLFVVSLTTSFLFKPSLFVLSFNFCVSLFQLLSFGISF